MEDIIFGDKLTAEDYNNLREKVNWSRLTDKQAVRGLENTTFLITAKVKDKYIGMGRVLFDYGCTAYICDVIVVPEYQKQGIGKRIMELLINRVAHAADQGDKIMFILGASKGKENFFAKLGFGLRPSDFYGAGMTRWIEVKKNKHKKDE